jgi:hypothetical protein
MALIPIQGMGQMTPAQQNTIRKAAGGTARASGRKRSKGRKRTRSKKRAAPRAKKRSTKRATKRSSGKRGSRLVKGSAAAKAYMKKIRGKRK